MNIQAEKLELIKMLVSIQDAAIIKKIKTRLSLLKHQLRFFITKKSYVNLVLSICAFVFFCAKDPIMITAIPSGLESTTSAWASLG